MNHLAIDTATEILSLALSLERDGTLRRYGAVRDVGLRHTASLMPLVDTLLAEAGVTVADLDLISCTRGPGSFTGLRIGMATAKGLAWAIAGRRGLDAAPLVSVPTLDVVAAALPPINAAVLPVIDGKKGRYFGAGFMSGERKTADLDLPALEIAQAVRTACGTDHLVVTGPHAASFAASLGEAAGDVTIDPRARAGWANELLGLAAERARTLGYDQVDQGPEYVRLSDAELSRG